MSNLNWRSDDWGEKLYEAAEVDPLIAAKDAEIAALKAEVDRLVGGVVSTALVISGLMAHVHAANAKWWQDLHTSEPIQRNVGEMLMLIVSELAEAMEGHRKGLMDDKLTHRPMIEVELADAMIRILDMAAGMKFDLAGAFVEKMEFNRTRIDHTVVARLAPGGKAY